MARPLQQPAAVLLALAVWSWYGSPQLRAQEDIPASLAYAVVDLQTGRVLSSHHADRLDGRVQPGSLMKVVTLAAAIDRGVVDARTRIACTRSLAVNGRDLSCSHPVLAAPLGPATALAYSCNVFFATIARRLTTADLSSMAVRLGLPPIGGTADPVLTALGVTGPLVPPRQWIDVLGRVAGLRESGLAPSAARTIVDGLQQAAMVGTGSAIGADGVDALVKTGTIVTAGGQPQGLVVALVPAHRPTTGVVALGAGAAGRDVATLVPALVRQAARGHAAEPPVRLGIASGATYAVHDVPADEYVAGVLMGEAPPRAPRALLDALAIVARTYAAVNRRRHAAEGFELCDLTHCQVWKPPDPAALAAARATSGQVLSWNGRPATVFHSASCGGRLEAADEVWSRSGSLPWPFLRSRPDPAGHDDAPWQSMIEAPRLLGVLRQSGLRGTRLGDVQIVARTSSGRAKLLRFDGLVPDLVDANEFRLAVGRALGWQLLKSTWFDVERTGNGLLFRGRGNGHGVGLCVAGATMLAKRGRTPAAILAAYFPGTSLGQAEGTADSSAHREAGSDIRVVLPTERLADRERLIRLASRLLARATAHSGRPPPAALSIRFHATVQSYQRATGQPWWTSGTTAASRIELLPLEVLERRGILERTLLHELGHVVLATSASGRPRWYQEGAVLAMTGELGNAGRLGAGGCPDDAAFERARDGEALERLYLAALACFRRATLAEEGERGPLRDRP